MHPCVQTHLQCLICVLFVTSPDLRQWAKDFFSVGSLLFSTSSPLVGSIMSFYVSWVLTFTTYYSWCLSHVLCLVCDLSHLRNLTSHSVILFAVFMYPIDLFWSSDLVVLCPVAMIWSISTCPIHAFFWTVVFAFPVRFMNISICLELKFAGRYKCIGDARKFSK